MESITFDLNNDDTCSNCSLLTTEGQCVAGVAGQGRGGVALALWADVDNVPLRDGVRAG